MALTIAYNANGETIYTVEAKVRNLPANQGLNDNAMWLKIDTEIAAMVADGRSYVGSQRHDTVVSGINNRHGRA
jgi:hypothetical protein